MRRTFVAPLVAALALGAGAPSCSPEGLEPQHRSPSPRPTEDGRQPAGVLVRSGRWLERVDLESGAGERLLRLPAFDSFDVTLDGGRVAVARAKPTRREDERDPALLVADVAPGATWQEVGAGAQPAWSPDGSRLAALVVAEGQFVCPVERGKERRERPDPTKGCQPARRVAVFTPGKDEEPEVVLGASSWTRPAWGNERVYVVNALTGTIVFAPQTPGGTPDRRGVSAREAPAVSPIEDALLYSGAKGTLFLSAKHIGSELDVDAIDIAAWAPDGSVVAAVAGKEDQAIVVIDPRTGALDKRESVAGKVDAIKWFDDSRVFAYSVRHRRGSLVRLCDVVTATCRDGPAIPRDAEMLALAP